MIGSFNGKSTSSEPEICGCSSKRVYGKCQAKPGKDRAEFFFSVRVCRLNATIKNHKNFKKKISQTERRKKRIKSGDVVPKASSAKY